MSYETKLDFEKRIELKNAGITIGVSRDGSEFGMEAIVGPKTNTPSVSLNGSYPIRRTR